MKKTFLKVSLLFLASLGTALAQGIADVDELSGANKIVQLIRVETPPVIDGVRDAVWDTAEVIDDFHQMQPVEYAEPSEETVIRVLYDDDFLYVSGEMRYEDPSIIVANKLIQGANLRDEDKLRLYINPFNDGRNGYLFQVNPNGVRIEAIIENVRGMNFDWTGIWLGDSKMTDYGWFSEIAIPFKTISFDPNSDTWGISFLRSVKAKNEDIAWTSYNRSINPSNFGSAEGISSINQGVGLDLIPGLALTRSEIFDPRTSDTNLEPSLDVFYKFTPNLTGALTFNSDFSATDVDARQVQLTRFSLFVEEQRKFFLQEADIFEFGGLEQNGKPFFSRRIGIGPNNQQLDLDVGGKLTGRIGRWNIGALAVRQGGNDDISGGNSVIDDSDLFVGRVSANVLEQSSIGFIATHGNPRGDQDNSLIGADFNYLNTRSFDNVTIEGNLWYQQSDSEGIEGDDTAWGAEVVSPNADGLKGRIGYTEIGDNFNPALGFVNRRGIKQSEIVGAYTTRFAPDYWLRSMESRLGYDRITNSQGEVESEEIDINFIELENQTGDVFSIEAQEIREVLNEPFEISDGVTIPIGDYSFQRYGMELSTGGQRSLVTTLTLEDGEFFSGDQSTIGLQIDWLPNKYFTGSLEFEYNDIELPEGSFDVQLYRLLTEVAFNIDWSWINTIQYDNQSDLLGINSRLQYIPRAGQELFLVYNAGWLDEELDGFRKIGQSATIKLNYTYRF